MIDNTFATPYLCRPFEWGANIIVHSTTKFLGGHGTTIGGVIVDGGNFDWTQRPLRQLHHARSVAITAWSTPTWWASACRLHPSRRACRSCATSARARRRSIAGRRSRASRRSACAWSATSPTPRRWPSSWTTHPKVTWVSYPGLPSHPDHERAKKYLPKGAGAILGFGIKGGAAAGQKFIESLQLFSHLANVGDAKSLAIHPATTTHSQLTEEEMATAGVTPDFIRLSVGIEDIEDILWDLDQALDTGVDDVTASSAVQVVR